MTRYRSEGVEGGNQENMSGIKDMFVMGQASIHPLFSVTIVAWGGMFDICLQISSLIIF